MEKKNFLFVSFDALISDISWQVVKEGLEFENPVKENTRENEKNTEYYFIRCLFRKQSHIQPFEEI